MKPTLNFNRDKPDFERSLRRENIVRRFNAVQDSALPIEAAITIDVKRKVQWRMQPHRVVPELAPKLEQASVPVEAAGVVIDMTTQAQVMTEQRELTEQEQAAQRLAEIRRNISEMERS